MLVPPKTLDLVLLREGSAVRPAWAQITARMLQGETLCWVRALLLKTKERKTLSGEDYEMVKFPSGMIAKHFVPGPSDSREELERAIQFGYLSRNSALSVEFFHWLFEETLSGEEYDRVHYATGEEHMRWLVEVWGMLTRKPEQKDA